MAFDEMTAQAMRDVARLEHRVAELEAALRPFVDCNFTYFSGKVLGSDARLTREVVERARAALAAGVEVGATPSTSAIEADTLAGLRRYLSDVLEAGTVAEQVIARTALRMIATPPAHGVGGTAK